jgi:hypothetical protein
MIAKISKIVTRNEILDPARHIVKMIQGRPPIKRIDRGVAKVLATNNLLPPWSARMIGIAAEIVAVITTAVITIPGLPASIGVFHPLITEKLRKKMNRATPTENTWLKTNFFFMTIPPLTFFTS